MTELMTSSIALVSGGDDFEWLRLKAFWGSVVDVGDMSMTRFDRDDEADESLVMLLVRPFVSSSSSM